MSWRIGVRGVAGDESHERVASKGGVAVTRYRTIVADPPWRYGNQSGTVARGHARRHYGTMPTADICAIRPEAADDAHLWLWGVNGMIEDAYEVVRAWGFEPITLLTWCKKQPGVGYYLRNNTEHCIFATCGKPMVPADKPISTWYVWPRGEHSAKPDAFYDLVERVSPGPYLEMFARRARFGWDYWGDQSLGTATMEPAA
jgi:N6-adenosine-specific RNA methylase IME4